MKTTTLTKTTLTLAAAAFLAPTSASQAAVVNVDFGETPYTGASANGPIASGSVWNQFSISNDFAGAVNGQSMNNLLDDSGTPTTVGIAFGTGWAGFFNAAGPNNLQRDRAFTSGGGTGTFTISGLTPGGTYNLALMVDSADNGSIATDYTIGTTTMMAFGGSAGTDANGALTFTDGQTHALFSGISASAGGEITFSATQAAGSSFASFPGLQIEDSIIPEPSSAALLGLGGLALIRRRRK